MGEFFDTARRTRQRGVKQNITLQKTIRAKCQSLQRTDHEVNARCTIHTQLHPYGRSLQSDLRREDDGVDGEGITVGTSKL